MTLLNIFSLDDVHEENVLATLSQGQHLIGRGTLLKISDKRVSRNHAVIHVALDKITLTSIHLNPCFFRAKNGKNVTVLTKDQESELNDGDQFALLPDYWFKVKKVHECENFAPVNGKRIHEEVEEGNGCEEEEPIKKARFAVGKAQVITEPSFEAEKDEEISHASQQPVEQNITETTLNLPQQFEEKFEISFSPQQLDNTALIGDIMEAQPTENNLNEVKVELLESNVEFESGPSGNGTTQQQLRRERCWYGHKCFRKNPNHCDTFSHPRDQDYDSDAEDDRPNCPYGIACYRKNSDHRKEYKHSAKPAKKKTSNVDIYVNWGCSFCPHCMRKMGGDEQKSDYYCHRKDRIFLEPQQSPAKRKRPQKQSNPYESEDDDYDYDDPFLNDDSSDDYLPTDSDSSEEDTDDLQDLDVEYQERKRMLREAKKFTKKK
ncbi:aprataxin and PNK-like factor [Euwallacea similis]|uniref:aprataxin and PNK-like factor n=1 Tax=Euwallacea similis TaxID=1736056 RepID=UPI00344D0DD5